MKIKMLTSLVLLSVLTSLELQANTSIGIDEIPIPSYSWNFEEQSKSLFVSGPVSLFSGTPFSQPWRKYDDKIQTVYYYGDHIGPKVFFHHTNLSSVNLSGDVSVDEEAFYWCNINTVHCNSFNPGKLDKSAFGHNTSVIKLFVPYGTISKYKSQGWTEKVFTGGIFEYGKPAEENEPVPESRSQLYSYWEKKLDYKHGIELNIDISDIALEEKDSLNLRDHLTINRSQFLYEQPEWSSSNPSVVSINKGGMIKAVSEGEAIITCSFFLAKTQCNVRVYKSGLILRNNILFKPNNDDYSASVIGYLYPYQRTILKIPSIISFDDMDYRVNSIADYAFKDNSYIQSAEIPYGIKTIGKGAFKNCSLLESFTIKENIDVIGDEAFNGCEKLTRVQCERKEPVRFGNNAFGAISSACVLTVPYKSKEQYLAAGWNQSVFKGGVQELSISYYELMQVKNDALNKLDNYIEGPGVFFYNNVQNAVDAVNVAETEKQVDSALASVTQNLPKDNQKFYIFNNETLGYLKLDNDEVPMVKNQAQGSVISFEKVDNGFLIKNEYGRYIYLKKDNNGYNSGLGTTVSASEALVLKIYPSVGGYVFETNTGGRFSIFKDSKILLLGGYFDKWTIIESDGMQGESFIVFKDPEVKRICVANWDKDGDGEISFQEAASVTSLGSAFKGNYKIQRFDELKYFIGLKSLTDSFDGCTSLKSISIPQNVRAIGDKTFNYSSLETVYSYVEKPFEINEDIFDSVSFTAKLFVPYGSTNSYKRNNWTTYFYGGVFEFDMAGLVNFSFDDNPDYNLNATEGLGTYQEGNSKAVPGWTLAMTSPWCSSAVFEYGTKSKLNSKSIPSEGPNKSKSTAALGMTLGWGGTIDYYQKVKLSQGSYKLSYQAYNLNSESDRFHSNVKVVVDGVEYCSEMTSFSYGKWICDEIMFVIPRDIEAEIHVGGTAEMAGSLNNAVLLLDDFLIENLGISIDLIDNNSFEDLSSQDNRNSDSVENPPAGWLLKLNGEYCYSKADYAKTGSTLGWCAINGGDAINANDLDGVKWTHQYTDGEHVWGVWAADMPEVELSQIITGLFPGTYKLSCDVVVEWNWGGPCLTTQRLFANNYVKMFGTENKYESHILDTEDMIIARNYDKQYPDEKYPHLTYQGYSQTQSYNETSCPRHMELTFVLKKGEYLKFGFRTNNMEEVNGVAVPHAYDSAGWFKLDNFKLTFMSSETSEVADVTDVPINLNIQFTDDNVKAICVSNWDTNGDGELSYEEAAAVTDLGKVFYNSAITSFNELLYFTGLKSIGDHAFFNCSKLSSITIPTNVKTIGAGAFMACSSLTNVEIPKGVTSIGSSAFLGCSALSNVTSFIEKPFTFGDLAYYGISDKCALYVPKGTKNSYIASGWTPDVFRGGIFEMDATDINQINNNNFSELMYDLKGNRVYDLDTKGIYIINGKKVYVK